MTDDPRQAFNYFSNEYAQALQTYQAIEGQASTLLLMGRSDELRQFIVQFIEMALRARDLAIEKNETNFADWFAELVAKAQKLKEGVPQ